MRKKIKIIATSLILNVDEEYDDKRAAEKRLLTIRNTYTGLRTKILRGLKKMTLEEQNYLLEEKVVKDKLIVEITHVD